MLDRLNDHIRALAVGTPRVLLADAYARFLGHGVSAAEADRWYWKRSLVEPNMRGASELRHLWLDALDAAAKLELIRPTGWVDDTRSRRQRSTAARRDGASRRRRSCRRRAARRRRSAPRCSSARADRLLGGVTIGGCVDAQVIEAGRRADRARRPADARHLARRRRGVGDRTDLRRKRRGADRAHRAGGRRRSGRVVVSPRCSEALDHGLERGDRDAARRRVRARSSSTRPARAPARSATPALDDAAAVWRPT